jgi:uncharacterized membrane protein YqjE
MSAAGAGTELAQDRGAMQTNQDTTTDRSLGTIVRGLTEDFSTLFRSEVALAKLELKETVAGLGGGIGLFAGALFCGLFGLALLLVTLILVIALWIPAWASTLIIAVLLFIVTGVLAMMGKKKFSAVEFVPTETVKSVKADVEAIKGDIARVRSR